MRYYPPRYLFRRHEILRYLKNGERFLEIGPGSLNLTRELARYFNNGTLIEYNPYVTRLFAELPDEIRSRTDLIVDDFLSVEINGRFDCVIACEVMEHVADDELFLARARSALRPDGQLILSVPARMRFWSVHDEVVGHVRRYERNELRQSIHNHGFRDIKVISYGFPFVNFLRLLRIGHARLTLKERMRWDQESQTQESGLVGIHTPSSRYLGVLVNPMTTYPLSKLASLFNSYDISNGYLIIAEADGSN